MLEFPTRQVGEVDIFLRFMFWCQPSNHVTGHSTFLCLPLFSSAASSVSFPSSSSFYSLFLQIFLFKDLGRPWSQKLYSVLPCG